MLFYKLQHFLEDIPSDEQLDCLQSQFFISEIRLIALTLQVILNVILWADQWAPIFTPSDASPVNCKRTTYKVRIESA